MNILHIVQHMRLGGIEKLVFSIMRANEKNIYILAIEGSQEASFKAWPELVSFSNHIFFANKQRGFRFEIVRLIQHICQEHAISVIHSHHIGPLIYSSLASYSIKSVKYVHTQHDIWHLKSRKQWLIEYLIFTIKKNIHLIAVSTDILNTLKRLFPQTNTTLVHNGIDTQLFKPGDKHHARKILKLPIHATIIAHAGRLEEVKGQHYLIQAMTLLPETFYLAIAGTGSLVHELQKEMDRLHLSGRVCLLGSIENIHLLYQASDLFCLPSLNEGLPLAILEAQACNVPVISSDVGSCAEGIDPKSGCLVPAKDPEAIAKACLKLNHETHSPREYILCHFSLAALIEKYQDIYTHST